MIGTRFERLVVIAAADSVGPIGRRRQAWLCRCDCRTEKVVRHEDLRSGNTRSCGCLHLEKLASDRRTHGKSRTRTYYVWTEMKQRCFNPNNGKYANYGGRGITISDEWRDSFEVFLRDMGPKPDGMSIDRKDNGGNYESSNCRWATPAQQSANRRDNIIVEWSGERMILGAAIKQAGLPRKPVEHRLRRGWSFEAALTTPIKIR